MPTTLPVPDGEPALALAAGEVTELLYVHHDHTVYVVKIMIVKIMIVKITIVTSPSQTKVAV